MLLWVPLLGFAGGQQAVTAVTTGTAEPSLTESEVVAGGETIIITITGDTFVAAGAVFDATREYFFSFLDSDVGGTNGWNQLIRDNGNVTDVVRTSDTVVTITLSAYAAFTITVDNNISVTVPLEALVLSSTPLASSPGFIVTNEDAATGGKRRRGAPRERLYLPPHKKKVKEEPLPHEAALEEAKEELKAVTRIRAASKKELRSLAGQLGNINRSARALERRIDDADEITERLSDQYRALGDRITGYVDQLEELHERRMKRLRADDDRILAIIMEAD